MQERFAIWGQDANEQDVLILLELRVSDYQVNLYTQTKKALPEAFKQETIDKWIADGEASLPEGLNKSEVALSEDSLLPEDLKINEPGKIRTLQNEWAYFMLTQKLMESFLQELNDLKEKADKLDDYDQKLFDDTKAFWERMLEHRKERDISQERVDEVKEEVNTIFEKLKSLRKEENKQFDEESNAVKEDVLAKINAIQQQIKGGNLKKLFDELRGVQDEAKGLKIRRKHRQQLHQAFNDVFEEIKAKRNIHNQGKLDNRIEGLNKVISKMERSLDRDRKELDFQNRRVDNSNVSALEAQLRQAKINMLEDKIKSKEAKLADIHKTLNDLQKRAEKIEQQQEALAKKEQEQQQQSSETKEEVEASSEEQADPQEKKEVPEKEEAKTKAKDETPVEEKAEESTEKPETDTEEKQEETK